MLARAHRSGGSCRCEALEPRTLLSSVRAGDLDSTFNGTGLVTHDFPQVQLGKVAIQSDGKVIVAGAVAASGSEDFFVARFTAAGALDASFGQGGVVRTDLGGDDFAADVAIDSLGRIVVAGAGGAKRDFAVARYTPAGKLDSTFANHGIKLLDFGGDDRALALALTSNNRIVLTGQRFGIDGAGDAVPLARLGAEGSLDNSFGTKGTELLSLSGEDERFKTGVGHDLAVQANGDIVLAGSLFDGAEIFRAFAARLGPAGVPDKSFGVAGLVTFDAFLGDDNSGLTIAPLINGSLVVGTAENTFSASVDSNFIVTSNGKSVTPLLGFDINDLGDSRVADILPQPDGGFIVSASVMVDATGSGNGDSDFVLQRFKRTSSGAYAVDAAFGRAGIVQTNFGGDSTRTYDDLTGAALAPDGRIVAVGNSDAGVAIARYLSKAPAPSVASFTLVNADTGKDLFALTNGKTLDLSALPPHLAIRANPGASAGTQSVKFGYDAVPGKFNPSYHVETIAPFALFGDMNNGKTYTPGTLTPGGHTITATPYAGRNTKGDAGPALTIRFTVKGQRRSPQRSSRARIRGHV